MWNFSWRKVTLKMWIGLEMCFCSFYVRLCLKIILMKMCKIYRQSQYCCGMKVYKKWNNWCVFTVTELIYKTLFTWNVFQEILNWQSDSFCRIKKKSVLCLMWGKQFLTACKRKKLWKDINVVCFEENSVNCEPVSKGRRCLPKFVKFLIRFKRVLMFS